MRNVDKKYHLLYKTINLLNGKYYYGIHSTNEIEDGYLGSGKRLRYSIRKYGKENFKREILEMFDNREDLARAEQNLITKEMVQNKYCMNCILGGEKWNTIGMVSVKDKEGNTFKVFNDDPRYLSKEFISVASNRICVVDNDGKKYSFDKNDPILLSNDFISIHKNKVTVKDKNDKIFHVFKNDPRFLSGELKHITKGFINTKDKNGNIFHISKDDSRYLSGELIYFWKDKMHTKETKKKMSESSKGQNLGEKNGSYGTCWITNTIENKKIKKEELEIYILQGWSKGRKILGRLSRVGLTATD